MQADVILKEPPPWMPPSASQGGGTRRGVRGSAAPPRTPLVIPFNFPSNPLNGIKCFMFTIVQKGET